MPLSPSSGALRVHSVGADHGVGTWNNVLMGLWRAQPRLHSVQAAYDAGAALLKEQPQGTLVMVIAERSSPPPPADARNVFARMTSDWGAANLATAVSAEYGTLGTSVVRGVVTSILLLTRRESPLKMFGNTLEACHWLVSEARQRKAASYSGEDLKAAIEQLRARVDDAEKAAPR
jgi:hypothetical protein